MTFQKLATIAAPLLIAESTFQGVRSSGIGEFLVTAAALSVIVMALWNMVDRVRGGTAQKREISFAESVATADELKQAHGRISREREEVNREIKRLDEAQKETRASLEKLNDRVDAVPGRTIQLLRETKDLI